VVGKDEHFAYTANAHDGTISGFVIRPDGALSLLDANGTTATPGAGNLDLAFDHDGKYLYQLRSSGPITAYRVERDGHLSFLGVAGSMPGAVAGLAAR
jgi:6-phosphogluconolactonase (cycloisomerase 2 family)